jgi:hypothetical protein
MLVLGQGNIGFPGAKGEAGPQGRPGPEMSEDLLKRYFTPVVNLSERVGIHTASSNASACINHMLTM